VGGADGRHRGDVADDVREPARLREHGARHGHRVARGSALRAAGDHLRGRVEDGAVHGAAHPGRPPGDPRGDLRGGRGRRRDRVAALHEDHTAAVDPGHPGGADRSTLCACSTCRSS
jgi:hypothetical protein